MAISIEELGDHLKKYDKRIIFLGDGVPVFRARLTDEILTEEIKAGRDIQFAPANMNRQRADAAENNGWVQPKRMMDQLHVEQQCDQGEDASYAADRQRLPWNTSRIICDCHRQNANARSAKRNLYSKNVSKTRGA